MPPTGAGPLRLTLIIVLSPAVKLLGVALTALRTAAVIARDADFAAPVAFAVTVVCAVAATGVVPMVKVAVVLPAGIVTLTGTDAHATLLFVSTTSAPPGGAALTSVTVAVTSVPPTTLAAFSTKLLTTGFMVRELRVSTFPAISTAQYSIIPILSERGAVYSVTAPPSMRYQTRSIPEPRSGSSTASNVIKPFATAAVVTGAMLSIGMYASCQSSTLPSVSYAQKKMKLDPSDAIVTVVELPSTVRMSPPLIA